MRITRGLQPHHSEYVTLVAELVDEEWAAEVYEELLRHLDEIFTRGSRFPCAAFGRSLASKEEVEAWKKKDWDPIADERCSLTIEPLENGRYYVSGDYGLILEDWDIADVGVAIHGTAIALKTYTAGYGVDYLLDWLSERGASTEVVVEGVRYEFMSFDKALEQVKAAGQVHCGP
ncbi:MAG: hypothetical protein FJ278_23635, partial [Planctomycetes bacterium]|nr:hypothetical protein [Planctomycetota bacterium]